MNKAALIVIDIQQEYFTGGKLPLVGIDAAAEKASRLIADARERGDKVVHVRHEMPDPDAPIFTPGSSGVEIHPSVKPEDDEPVILKHYPNAFRETDLKTRLESEGVDEVIIIGAMTQMCIDGTSRAAVDLGYPTTVIHDACATRDLEFDGVQVPAKHVQAAFMAGLDFAYAKVISTENYLTERNS